MINEKDDFDQIFRIYGDDDFFEIFIYRLIDKKIINSLRESHVLWIFVNYAKQICSEVDHQLEIYQEIKQKGKYEVPGIKWSFNLKNEEHNWTNFCFDLLLLFFGIPLRKYSDLNKPQLSITDPVISDNEVYFNYDNRRYVLILNNGIKQAAMRVEMNGEHIQPSTLDNNITIRKGRNHFTLYKTKYRDLDDYKDKMRISFFANTKILKMDLGLSILQLYKKKDIDLNLLDDDDNNINNFCTYDVELLANNSSIKSIVENVNNEIKEHYEEFIRYKN